MQAATVHNAAARSIENKTGQSVKTLSVEDLHKASYVLNLSTQKQTIVYVFSPHCHWCALNIENIEALAQSKKDHVEIIGLSVTADGLPEYLAKNRLPFPVYVEKSPKDLSNLNFTGTPQTLLISRDGSVAHNWIGAYTGATLQSIEEELAVTLPGINSTSSMTGAH